MLERIKIIVIPAIKKNVAFPDDLIKKLHGVTLIQRTIDCAKKIGSTVFVITDSEEIHLICQRNNIFSDFNQTHDSELIKCLDRMILLLNKHELNCEDILLLSPYAPILKSAEIMDAYNAFLESGAHELRSFKEETRPIYQVTNNTAEFCESFQKKILVQQDSLYIYRLDLQKENDQRKIFPFILDKDSIEIHSHRDWWICEKILKRKRILFRVIGNNVVGMGHIYRTLSIAHEISDHEVVFICDEKERLAVNSIAGSEYWIEAVAQNQIVNKILTLKPDMVIHDQLETDLNDVLLLQKKGIKVVNFEDLGPAAPKADLTINELYDDPQYESTNTLWGNSYSFLRDEFEGAKIKTELSKIERILLTFGGTDPSNFTLKSLKILLPYCHARGITLHIVSGSGYLFKTSLEAFLKDHGDKNITFTNATGVISKIMERVDLAICSNGRTVYELAHMHIPAIVISHHEREQTHKFACEENGFIPYHDFNEAISENLIALVDRFVSDKIYRDTFFSRICQHDFSRNKSKVINSILGLL